MSAAVLQPTVKEASGKNVGPGSLEIVIVKAFWPTVLAGVALIFLGVVAKLSAKSVWDDAYMFVRYADNLLGYGLMAWNPGDTPTYGLTSLLFVAVVLPVRWLLGENPARRGVVKYAMWHRLYYTAVFPGLALLGRRSGATACLGHVACRLIGYRHLPDNVAFCRRDGYSIRDGVPDRIHPSFQAV